MTDGGEIEALVRRLCAARVAGDMGVLRRGYADNATFRIAGSPAWGALTAPVTGHAKIMARFESMIANLALSDFAILDLFVDGCRPLASQRVPCGNRDASTTEIAQFLEVEHGQVVSLVEFFDTAMAMKLLGAK